MFWSGYGCFCLYLCLFVCLCFLCVCVCVFMYAYFTCVCVCLFVCLFVCLCLFALLCNSLLSTFDFEMNRYRFLTRWWRVWWLRNCVVRQTTTTTTTKTTTTRKHFFQLNAQQKLITSFIKLIKLITSFKNVHQHLLSNNSHSHRPQQSNSKVCLAQKKNNNVNLGTCPLMWKALPWRSVSLQRKNRNWVRQSGPRSTTSRPRKRKPSALERDRVVILRRLSIWSLKFIFHFREN